MGAKKPRASSATAAYTKTGGKDGKGRVVYVSAKGVERVRCRSAATGKAEWRKPATVSAKMDGGLLRDMQGYGYDNRQAFEQLNQKVNGLTEVLKKWQNVIFDTVMPLDVRIQSLKESAKMDGGDEQGFGVGNRQALEQLERQLDDLGHNFEEFEALMRKGVDANISVMEQCVSNLKNPSKYKGYGAKDKPYGPLF